VPTQTAQPHAPAQEPIAASGPRGRDQIADHVLSFEKDRLHNVSQRRFTKERGIPRSTMQGWLKQKQSLQAPAAEVAFFESPAGLALLHRIVLAAHLVMSLVGACGVRLVCLFLQKAGLDPFVANSYGAQRKVAKKVEEETVKFGKEERERLRATMEPRPITLVEDETFHQQPCLVAIEPVANFILVEEYSEHRDSARWQQAVKQGLSGLPVEVVQVSSDQGKAILKHVETELGVHQSPDVFHVQYDVSRGTSAVLAARWRQAEARLDQASSALQEVLQQEQDRAVTPPGPGRPPDFAGRAEAAQKVLHQAQQELAAAKTHQEAIKEVLQGISTAYHPYDLGTGTVRTAQEVKTELGAQMERARSICAQADLPARCLERVEKAARVVPKMVATVAFFHTLVATWVDRLGVSRPVMNLLLRLLIPMLYLQRVAGSAKDAATRAALKQVGSQLEVAWRASRATWQALPEEMQQRAWALAEQCAHLFQRSSSCVEGRNGQLSLRHHHLHQIGRERLQALTVIHNFELRRADGTTAAERFFGQRPADLFTALCQRVPLPARPRKGRRKPLRPSMRSAPMN
jgi:Family of unknown function (DUF6399)